MFNEDQKKFIARAFGRNTSPTKVRQEFLKHFNVKKGQPTARYKLYQFTRLNQHFETYGSIAHKSPKKVKTKRTNEKIQEVENFLAENHCVSLRKAGPQISTRVTTVWRILRYDLHFKFYRITSVQPLKDIHKQQRLQFCQWLLAQPEDFVQKIVWTDEKMFCLHQKPHRKNDGEWSRNNPH